VSGPWVDDTNVALLTDLYQFTMLEAYLEEGLAEDAAFTLFVRRLPPRRNFLIACGLDAVLSYLENLRFNESALECLRSLGRFSDRSLGYLREFRFTGSVTAVPEGTPVFAEEPLLEVVAPLPQAQLVETCVMNQIHVQTMAASKSVRLTAAAQGRALVDFGLRRDHGADAGLKVARAAYVAGVQSTSNVLAGCLYGIPVAGTMGHSYIQAHPDQLSAFEAFARTYPRSTLLVDTYDTLDGVRDVIRLAQELGPAFQINGIRLDSGDLISLSRQARQMLDEAGLRGVEIFASGGLDEDRLEELVRAGAPITGFGVGSAIDGSDDSPHLDLAYKLVWYAGEGRIKLSPGKELLPGRKQVFRIERDGLAERDILAERGESQPGRPLLVDVMRDGVRISSEATELRKARRRAQEEVSRLPERVRSLKAAEPPYPVEISSRLSAARERIEARHRSESL
jgi:nicotinate phosphoribosyltransferase